MTPQPPVRGRPPEWPRTKAEALEVQQRLRAQVDVSGPGPHPVRAVAGLDTAYDGDRLAAAVVVIDPESLATTQQATVTGTAAFGYVPGLFAFREMPALLDALGRLDTMPDLLICDGHGIAHPRRFGLACHIGVVTGIPAIGVAKTPLAAQYAPPGERRGAWSPLEVGGEVAGRVLRTQDRVKPVFVSPGHGIGIEAACEHVLRLAPRYRLPETTRRADCLARCALRLTS